MPDDLEAYASAPFSNSSESGTVVVDGDDRAAIRCAFDLDADAACGARCPASVVNSVNECALDSGSIDVDNLPG